MKQKMRKRGRILSMILTAIILITSLSSNLVYATEADGNSSVQTRTLTISAGEGGSVEVKDFPEQESYQFAPGEKVNLIVSEDPGYIFLELKSEEDVNMDTISDSEITFIMPDQDIEITPIFEKQDQDSNLSETDPVVEDNQKETRFNLAHEMGLDAWVDDDGYLLEDYYEDKTDLELSQLGVAPLVKAIDLNNGIMPLTVTKYEKVTYGNNIVGYFEVDGHPAMCCEHDLSTPSVGYATGSPELITDNRLRIVMYYGYTGPGNIFSDYNKGCVATSLALSYYVRGLSSTGMSGAHSQGAINCGMSDLIYKVEQGASVPDTFKVYRVTTGGSTQRLMYSVYTPKTYTSLTVQKTWNDQNNKYNLRPSSVKINLYRWSNKNSTRVLIGSANITPSNNEWNWKVTWNNLIRTDGDTIYDYTAQEEAVPGYIGKMSWEGSYEAGWVGTLTNTLQQGELKLKKASSLPDMTDGSDCYSLEGAEYGVYSSSSLSGASKVGTLTTDADGNSNTLSLNAGTYYIKEITAPKGFALDPITYTVTVSAGSTAVLSCTDLPQMYPVGVLLGKIDAETNKNKPQGSASLEGAQFTVKFYDGLYDTDPAASGETAKRTWVFATDEDGWCQYDTKYLISGDSLYTTKAGTPSLPIGTITIQETKAPEGYLINNEVFVRKITSDGTSESVTTYNYPKIPENILKLDLVKKQAGTDLVIPEASFEHTRPDGTTEILKTDENGCLSIKGLTYGNHKIREIAAPNGYALNENIVEFTVAEDNTITLKSKLDDSLTFDVTEEGNISMIVEDKLAPFELQIHKQNQKGTVLSGAEFTLYSDAECLKEVTSGTSDDTGVISFDGIQTDKTYYLKETQAPNGYRLPYTVTGQPIIYEIRVHSEPVNNEFTFYVNGTGYTTDSEGMFTVTGTKEHRVANMTIINTSHMRNIFAYLTKNRYIDPEIVQEMVDRKFLYQDQRHNCVFVSRNSDQKPLFACLRGTNTFSRRFVGDLEGCDYNHCFFIDNKAHNLVVTESPIESLSYMALLRRNGQDYHMYDFLSLAGTGKYASVLHHYQEKEYGEIIIGTNNDSSGQESNKAIHKLCQNLPVKLIDQYPEQNDWNDKLKYVIGHGYRSNYIAESKDILDMFDKF